MRADAKAKSGEMRALSGHEIEAVSGAYVNVPFGGLGCVPILADDGHGGIIVISPTTGRYGKTFPF